MTDADRTAALIGLLEERGIRCWVVGGWGIDALLGRATRQHKDLDLLVARPEHALMWRLLHAEGFRLAYLWEENTASPDTDEHGEPLPTAYVLTHEDGRELDVHVLDGHHDVLVPLWTSDRVLIDGALDATGSIAGRTVRCMSAEMQRLAHTGYELPDSHRRDLELLDELTALRHRRGGSVPWV